MESNIKYQGEELTLTDDFIDIGYMAENISVVDIGGSEFEIKRSHPDKAMTLLVSLPTIKGDFIKELQRIDTFMSAIEVDIYCYFIFASEFDDAMAVKNRLEKFELVFDTQEEFGPMYGTQIVSGSLEGQLTKSLFLISKDGAIFYLDMPDDLDKPFDLERLRVELNKAYTSYTGVGCHG